jgi:hypothetical protein
MAAEPGTGGRLRRTAIGIGAACGLAGILVACLAVPGAVDGPIAVDLHITTTATSVDVHAPGWFSDASQVYLCPSIPPPLPEAAADRIGWTPGGDCHDYGRHPAPNGLTVGLPTADLVGAERAAFASAGEWYLLLLDMDGERISSAVRSAFGAPGLSPAS